MLFGAVGAVAAVLAILDAHDWKGMCGAGSSMSDCL